MTSIFKSNLGNTILKTYLFCLVEKISLLYIIIVRDFLFYCPIYLSELSALIFLPFHDFNHIVKLKKL
jgi:hypothetical protein